ncbi:hypothetical protein BC834DRAFT_841299 [Gloeopeniophorella convolvens]|nr:hypothetical protein BC834DRAFT_841299 [Gloeopeniophorella convolvens]
MCACRRVLLRPLLVADPWRTTHSNLMVDSFIANATVEDLRATVRSLLATMPPSTATAFTKAARSRLAHPNASSLPPAQALFTCDRDGNPIPTPAFHSALAHARALYGAGMGLSALGVLTAVVRRTAAPGLRWPRGADVLALLDADVCQALQSSREELDSGRASDLDTARAQFAEIRAALRESAEAAARTGGDFAFEHSAASLEVWKV